ncbi:uncharacterized protein DUF3857 [Neolewinella xylanilytica]|uniref:Uncharacterized protein DUF3857 n=1 Tax=Neolewinella xylanilytica TaxID=1514080 RepID=A0A2S6I521_9BACT|nr:DUF3857 domain-containing protein [Neolewinella xylanilytica]PPK86245.1 uncharacterized protein DUF3857 [Neolewinella xylanilytica]
MPHLTLVFVFLVSITLSAQDIPDIRFGMVSDADRQLTIAANDTAAEAYVLYNRLTLDFSYSDIDGAGLIEKHHKRIKLLRPASFSRADVVLAFDREYEEIDEVEAFIHFPTGGTLPVRPEAIIHENDGGTREKIKFTFPQVTEGVIIEYRYTHKRRSILIPTPFEFQQDIPVRWAQYDAMIPPYYGYVTLGTADLDVKQSKFTKRAWGPRMSSGAYSSSQQKIEHADVVWAMRDLPAFRSQPYSNNASDYIPKIQLQLQNITYPTGGKQTVFGDWEETVKELQERQDFGRYYRNKINYGKVWKAVEQEMTALPTDREKITAAYRFVTKNINWNGDYFFLATGSPNQIFDTRIGNSADLNIMLLSLLNEAGIEAHPLLVSLRNTGAPIEQYPLLDQFNHLMVYTEVDGLPLLLDANDPNRPPGLPREDALNHRAWVGDKDNPRWIDIEVPSSRQVTMVEMHVAPDGRSQTKLKGRLDNYYAFSGRSRLAEETAPEAAPVVRELVAHLPETQVTSFEVTDQQIGRPEQLDFQAELIVPAGQAMNDYLYLQPVLLPMLDGELADAEERFLPIDFPYPWEQRYIATIHLPEGYDLEEVPSSLRLKTEDGSMGAVYSVQQGVPGTVTISFTVQMARTLYLAKEYGALRDMFRRVIELQETPLVLKKTAK